MLKIVAGEWSFLGTGDTEMIIDCFLIMWLPKRLLSLNGVILDDLLQFNRSLIGKTFGNHSNN